MSKYKACFSYNILVLKGSLMVFMTDIQLKVALTSDQII